MKLFKLPIFKKISGASGKALGDDEVMIVPRADGLYRSYKEGGVLIEKKIFDQSHQADLQSIASGLASNIGAVRNMMQPGDVLRAEEMESISSGDLSPATIIGTTSVEPVSSFEAVRDALNNGKISIKNNGTEYLDQPLSLANTKFAEEVVVNHVNYAGSLTATSKRGMTINIPVASKAQGIINKLSIYLVAGKTYQVKLYKSEVEMNMFHSESVEVLNTGFNNIYFNDLVLNANDKITVTVEASNFTYFYPVGTPNYTKSWSDAGSDGSFDIQNTLPIKLYVYPALAIVDGDITSLIPFIETKINELIGVTPTITYTDKFEITFAPGFREFDIVPCSGVDIFEMLGFTAGRTTIYGEGYTPGNSSKKLIRTNDKGAIDQRVITYFKKVALSSAANELIINNIPDHRILEIEVYIPSQTSNGPRLRFNDDDTNVYTNRVNHSSSVLNGLSTGLQLTGTQGTTFLYSSFILMNDLSTRKMFNQGSATSSTASYTFSGDWNNVPSGGVNKITLTGNNMAAGSYIIVRGRDL